jgi:hypothetical protein
MSAHRVFRYLVLGVGILAGLACGDYAHPTSPSSSKVVSPAAPSGVSYSRWILISGAWVCVDGCNNRTPSLDN